MNKNFSSHKASFKVNEMLATLFVLVDVKV